jgi:hypothetical protein
MKRKLIGAAIALTVLTVTVLSIEHWGPQYLPKCDSSNATTTLTKTFDGSQFARTLNLSVIVVSDASESSYDSHTRKCSAVLMLNNNSKLSVDYEMEIYKDGRYTLTFKERATL